MDERHDHDPRFGPTPGLDALELRQLRQFLAVAEELNFTRAADRLHVAQQALSASVRRLEAQLGVTLFERDTRRVQLTPAGEVLVVGARRVVEAAMEALDEVHAVAAGRSGRLTIGFSTATGGVPIVRELIRRFAENAPDVDIRTLEHDFSDPSAGLVDGEVGVAFVFGPPPAADLSSIPVLTESRMLAVRPEHPLAAKAEVRAVDLEALPWLRVPADRGPWTDSWFPRSDPPGPTIRTADEWVAAVESGRGVAFTMPTVMAGYPSARIALVAIADAPAAEILLAWPRDRVDPVVATFVAAARDRLAQTDGTDEP